MTNGAKRSSSRKGEQQLTARDWEKATRELQSLSVQLAKIQAKESGTAPKKSS